MQLCMARPKKKLKKSYPEHPVSPKQRLLIQVCCMTYFFICAGGAAYLAGLLAVLYLESSPRLESFHIGGAVHSTFQSVMPAITQLSRLRVLKLCGSRFEVRGDGLENLDAIAGLSALQVCPMIVESMIRTPPCRNLGWDAPCRFFNLLVATISISLTMNL